MGTFANIMDPDETARNEHLHCLPTIIIIDWHLYLQLLGVS